jgi:hypothetical protein
MIRHPYNTPAGLHPGSVLRAHPQHALLGSACTARRPPPRPVAKPCAAAPSGSSRWASAGTAGPQHPPAPDVSSASGRLTEQTPVAAQKQGDDASVTPVPG